ncbi:hypothetical protein EWM62_05880 [Mucilaginibacter terrigena]|uniref:Uncharacterized protein n=1 Tax=Mucilaginibacter terrigena TaxID=2492395 RepID=A0A4Q5LPX7_9SPHI|nr:hypothetical protein [Mucilaginibacter terrigena]RYU91467.1 hypothetical protein EWM62_05880 [Mucilaginibacter terrigena]
MKKHSTIRIMLMLLITGFSTAVYAQKDKKANADTEAWRYELEVAGTGVQGTYLLKVWSYSKKPNVAIEQAKKNAVHGIIFKGFAGDQGILGKPPLTTNSNLEQEKDEWFKAFFADGGKYQKFVSLASDGAVAAEDRMKVGKQYKIGVLVSVNVALLRKDLEDAGIIKSLNAGF